MTRLFSLALACVILASSLAVPASAAETGSKFFNILDYCLPNDGDTSFVTVTPSNNRVSFSFPELFAIASIDIVVDIGGAIPSSVAFVGYSWSDNLTVQHIGNSLYRIYGTTTPMGVNSFDIQFNINNTSWITFHRVDIAITSFDRFDIPAHCDISSSLFSDTINYNPSDTINHRIFATSSDYSDTHFRTVTWADDWRKYDYIDFLISYDVAEITSISARLDGSILPFTVNYIQSSPVEGNSYDVFIRLDLTGVDRSSSGRPIITLEGRLDVAASAGIYFLDCIGHVEVNNVSPVFYYLRMVKAWIQNLGDRIVSALNGNTSSGDEFKDDSSGLISDLDDISGVLDSVQRPSMDNVSMDFTGNISGATSLMATTFDSFTSIPWVNTIFMASITLALISYILFGKE